MGCVQGVVLQDAACDMDIVALQDAACDMDIVALQDATCDMDIVVLQDATCDMDMVVLQDATCDMDIVALQDATCDMDIVALQDATCDMDMVVLQDATWGTGSLGYKFIRGGGVGGVGGWVGGWGVILQDVAKNVDLSELCMQGAVSQDVGSGWIPLGCKRRAVPRDMNRGLNECQSCGLATHGGQLFSLFRRRWR